MSSKVSRWFCPKNAQLELLYLGWGRRYYGSLTSQAAQNDAWEYMLIRQGNPVLILENGPQTMSPNEIVIIHPKCAFCWTDQGNRRSEILTWVWRNPPRCIPCIPPFRSVKRWRLNPSVIHQLEKIHAACRHEVAYPDECTVPTLEYLHLQLDVTISRTVHVKKHPSSAALQLELAIQWMHQNPFSPDPVTSLCDYLQISPSTLGRMFLNQFGEPPFFYYQRLRMLRAKEMMKTGVQNIKQIAYSLGYQHPNDFSRAFKIFWRKSPKFFTRSHPINR